jgi:hypothetical protein
MWMVYYHTDDAIAAERNKYVHFRECRGRLSELRYLERGPVRRYTPTVP